MQVRREAWRLASARHQMHQEAHGRDSALPVIHEPHELTQRRLSAQVHSAVDRWIVMVIFDHLHELDPSTEVIHQLLVARGFPPLCGEVELPARRKEPEGRRGALLRFDLVEPVLRRLRDVDVPAKLGDAGAGAGRFDILSFAAGADGRILKGRGEVAEWPKAAVC